MSSWKRIFFQASGFFCFFCGRILRVGGRARYISRAFSEDTSGGPNDAMLFDDDAAARSVIFRARQPSTLSCELRLSMCRSCLKPSAKVTNTQPRGSAALDGHNPNSTPRPSPLPFPSPLERPHREARQPGLRLRHLLLAVL